MGPTDLLPNTGTRAPAPNPTFRDSFGLFRVSKRTSAATRGKDAPTKPAAVCANWADNARLPASGKLVWRSLATKIFSVAKIKLGDVENEERAKLEGAERLLESDATFGEALAHFEKKLHADVKLKPGAKLYRRKTITALLKSWPSLKNTRLAKLSDADCREWATRFHTQYSPSVYNNTLATLQMVIDLGVSSGVRCKNPDRGSSRAKVTQRQLNLPSHDEFLQLVNAVADGGGRFSRDCANLVHWCNS